MGIGLGQNQQWCNRAVHVAVAFQGAERGSDYDDSCETRPGRKGNSGESPIEAGNCSFLPSLFPTC